jgi:hypothetical protein
MIHLQGNGLNFGDLCEDGDLDLSVRFNNCGYTHLKRGLTRLGTSSECPKTPSRIDGINTSYIIFVRIILLDHTVIKIAHRGLFCFSHLVVIYLLVVVIPLGLRITVALEETSLLNLDQILFVCFYHKLNNLRSYSSFRWIISAISSQ